MLNVPGVNSVMQNQLAETETLLTEKLRKIAILQRSIRTAVNLVRDMYLSACLCSRLNSVAKDNFAHKDPSWPGVRVDTPGLSSHE